MSSNNNKCNILLVANWESNVGYAWWLMENFWTVISDNFALKNKSCKLIYPKITTIPASIKNTDIETIELNFVDHSISNLLRLYKLIKSQNIRYLYLSDAPSYSWFYILLRIFGIRKIVIHDHTPGDRTNATGLLKIIKTIINRIPYFNADHFIAVSNFVHQRHLNVNCFPAKKCSVAANGIYPYDLSNINNNYARQKFSIPQDRYIIVNTGRASFYKGIDFYIKCADELINNQGLKQLHFLFCGDGPEMKQFRSLCNKLKLDQHFTFTGKRSDIQMILPSCDIGFHAAHGEVGYSLSILEYMSAGLATIVPDNPSTSDATRHSETGLVYQHKNTDSACEAIKQCLSDDFRKHLAKNAIEEVKQHYNIHITNEKLLSILKQVYT